MTTSETVAVSCGGTAALVGGACLWWLRDGPAPDLEGFVALLGVVGLLVLSVGLALVALAALVVHVLRHGWRLSWLTWLLGVLPGGLALVAVLAGEVPLG